MAGAGYRQSSHHAGERFGDGIIDLRGVQVVLIGVETSRQENRAVGDPVWSDPPVMRTLPLCRSVAEAKERWRYYLTGRDGSF